MEAFQDRATCHVEEWQGEQMMSFYSTFKYSSPNQRPLEVPETDCVSPVLQPWGLHERRNVSVAVWSSEQAEPNDAGRWHPGRSFRPALLIRMM